MKLTERQERALKRLGQDVCVVAGPGSGKTAVLVNRFAWLVAEQGISPLRILAITFTEKAATQIKARLAERFAKDLERRRLVERAYVSTIHGFCTRLLREHAIEAGVDPEFTVLDEARSRSELEAAAEEALESLYQSRPAEFRDLLEALHVSTSSRGRRPDLACALCDIYDAARAAGVTVGEVRARSERQAGGGLYWEQFIHELRTVLRGAGEQLTGPQRDAIDALRAWAAEAESIAFTETNRDHFELLSRYPDKLPPRLLSPDLRILRDERRPLLLSTLAGAYYMPLKALLLDAWERMDALYRKRKRDLAALDFADLEEHAIELLAPNRPAAKSIREQFDHILMDELQDTNPLQWRLMNLLRRPGRFFAVGDINQSIYGFRHAEPEVFENYRRSLHESGGEIDELIENFRSRAEILEFTEPVLGEQPGIRKHEFVARRAFPPKETPSVEIIAAFGDEGTDPRDVEAFWIARRIGELVGVLSLNTREGLRRPLSYRDVAVLARTTQSLVPIQRAFQTFGIPYLTEGGRTFFEAREVRDLILLLKCIADPEDEVSMAGVLRSPLAGLSDETLLRIKTRFGRLSAILEEPSAAEAAGEDAERERLDRFVRLLQRLRRRLDFRSPDRLLVEAMDEFDYEGGLSNRQRSNVAKLLARLREWRFTEGMTSDEIVAMLDYLRDAGVEAEAPPEDSSDAVRMMTIHKAKGLEFPVVFLAALDRGTGGSDPVIRLSPEAGIGVCWRDPTTGLVIKDLPYRQAAAAQKQKEEAEERRLLFVAMTRAEEHLVLSFAKTPRPKGMGYELLKERLGLALDPPAENVWHTLEARPSGVPVQVLMTSQIPGPPELPPALVAAVPEPLIVERPPAPGQYDTAASVTDVQLFAQCPYRYYLGRYLGYDRLARTAPPEEPEIPPSWEDREGLDAAEFGTLVHDLLAGKPVEQAPEEAVDLVRRFQTSALGLRAARAARVEREFGFLMPVEDVALHGRIDLWFEEGGELILADYKTDIVDAAGAQEHAARYTLQLQLYAMALERLQGRRPDQAYVCLLRAGLAVPVSLEREGAAEVVEIVRRFRESQSNLRFEMKVSPACVACPYHRRPCPAETPGV